MRSLTNLALGLALAHVAGCSGEPVDACLDADKFPVFADEDQDGYGGEKVGDACEVAAGQVEAPLDCDDADPQINPEAGEDCDGLDNDCDGTIDDGLDTVLFYQDLDGDGYGTQYPTLLACDKPDQSWVRNKDDCNDDDASISPSGQEVCAAGDEDCDGLAGDADDTVDPSTFETFFRDKDHDGKGDSTSTEGMCTLQFGFSENTLDCDDDNELVGQYKFFHDVDEDGYGNPIDFVYGCVPPTGYVQNNIDCDDADATVNIDRTWYVDDDLDGYGAGAVSAISCLQPYGTARTSNDCDDTDASINPGIDEFCGNGIDEDCDGGDLCDTCQTFKTLNPSALDGVYTLETPTGTQQAYCDMTVDGGGWTMVASSRQPVDDAGGGFYGDLLTTNPAATNLKVWDGMREEMGSTSDIRFQCRVGAVVTVDLSFYRSPWYDEITASTMERNVCFEQDDGCCNTIPAERKNNLTGDTRARGDDWDFGYLEGENACNDSQTFVIDFDDGGVNGNASDGTDWGELNGVQRCGTTGVNGIYFLYVRE